MARTDDDTVAARRGRAFLTPVLVALIVIAVAAFSYRIGSASAGADADAAATPTATATPTETADPSAADVYAAVAPSVVVVTTENGTGSGVIVTDDGGILTALHVVDGAAEIEVTFADGTVSAAVVSTQDDATDIAALTPTTLPEILVPATIGNADALAAGDDVIAIGTPLGLSWSVSSGIVSGLDRTGQGEDGAAIEGLIQFDAAVNPGSSGGPLVDAEGNVVGIVIALLTTDEDGSFAGIGLAVPISTATGGAGGGEGPQK